MLLRYGYNRSPRRHGGAHALRAKAMDIRLSIRHLYLTKRPVSGGVARHALSHSERIRLIRQKGISQRVRDTLLHCDFYGLMPPTVVCPHTDGHPLWRNLLIPGERMKRQLSMMLFFALVPSTTFPLFFLLFILPTSPGMSIPTLTELL